MNEEQPIQKAEVTQEVPGKVGFGPEHIDLPQPIWAIWFFRIFFYVTSTLSLSFTIFTEWPVKTKLKMMEIVSFSNLAVHGASKMFGIEVPQDETYYYPKKQ